MRLQLLQPVIINNKDVFHLLALLSHISFAPLRQRFYCVSSSLARIQAKTDKMLSYRRETAQQGALVLAKVED